MWTDVKDGLKVIGLLAIVVVVGGMFMQSCGWTVGATAGSVVKGYCTTSGKC